MHDNINVNVSGPVQPTSQYKTVMLKGNLPFALQVTEPNTKYVIKHNFDLGGESITIPEGCLLEFDGGSISNGTLVGQNTILIYNQPLNDILTATLEGTWRHESGVKADEEDITDLNGELKLKDRGTTDGMGRIILRKNKSFAEQLTQENTVYEIRYDFDLNEADVTIPANCVLEFDGGSLSNGSCICQNTGIEGTPKFINISNIGTVAQNYIDLSWFELSDYATLLQNFANATDGANAVVFIPCGTWVISSFNVLTSEPASDVRHKSTFTIRGSGASSIIDINGGGGIRLCRRSFVENLSIQGSSNNFALTIGGNPATYGEIVQGTIISGVHFWGNVGGALGASDHLINLTVENCFFLANGNANTSVCYLGSNNSTTIVMDRCYFSNNMSCKCALYITADIGFTYITRSIFESSSRLIQATRGNLSVEDCYFEYVTDYAIVANEYVRDVRVRSCEFKYQVQNKLPYILLSNMGKAIIENNIFSSLKRDDNTVDYLQSIAGENMYNAVYKNNSFLDGGDMTPILINPIKKDYISNLVIDSSFKNSYTPTTYFERIDTDGCFDNFSLRYHSTTQTLAHFTKMSFSVDRAKRYVLSFYAKNNSQTGALPIRLILSGSYQVNGQLIFIPSADWERYVFVFESSETVTWAQLNMLFTPYFKPSEEKPVDILIDDVQFEQLNEGNASEYVMTGDTREIKYKGRQPVLGGSIRPIAPAIGDIFFDKTLGTNGKPIWYNGTDWVDATGATV